MAVILVDGTQDGSEYLEVDLSKLPAAVTITTEMISAAVGPTPTPSGSTTTTARVAADGNQLAATGSQSIGLLPAALAPIAIGAVITARRRETR